MRLAITKLKPKVYYRYKSILEEVLFEYKFNTVGIYDDFFSKPSQDDLVYYTWFREFINKIKNDNPNIFIESNKIVIGCETPNGNIINVCWFDGSLIFGYGRRGDDWIKPINLNHNEEQG